MTLRMHIGMVVLVGSSAAACGSSATTTPPGPPNAGNGVDDVKAACGLRAQWKSAQATACLSCVGAVPMQPCECSPDPTRGRCSSQSLAKGREPDCTTALGQCVAGCANDCVCEDRCYAGHDACRPLAAALDGCIVAACDATCR